MIWAFIPGWLKRAVAWLAAGLAVIGGAWLAGKREGAVRADLKTAKDNIKTTERMQDAPDFSDSPDDARNWLRDRNPKQR